MPSLYNAPEILGKTATTEDVQAEKGSWEHYLATMTPVNLDDVVEENWTVIFLGDIGCGKTSLVGKLRNAKNSEHNDVNFGLDYSYINLVDGEEEDHLLGIVDVWQLSGVEEHAPLLKIGSNLESLNDTVFVICLDLSQPWNALQSLERWITVIKDHLDAMDYPDGYREKLQELVKQFVQSYESPPSDPLPEEHTNMDQAVVDEDAPKKDEEHGEEEGEGEENGEGEHGKGEEGEEDVVPVAKADDDAQSAAANTRQATPAEDVHPRARRRQAKDYEKILLPLKEGVLATNLGVSILVVGTKSDSFEELDKHNAFKEAHFDYIQYQLRSWCLEYGAGLVYTSTRDNINIELLHDYLKHILYYEVPLRHPPKIMERNGIFIPIGWDTRAKISACQDSSRNFVAKVRGVDGEDPAYSDVIKKPPDLFFDLGSETAEITALDNQDFLKLWQKHFEDPDHEPKPKMQGMPELLIQDDLVSQRSTLRNTPGRKARSDSSFRHHSAKKKGKRHRKREKA